MEKKITCPGCGGEGLIYDPKIGRKRRCPTCKAKGKILNPEEIKDA